MAKVDFAGVGYSSRGASAVGEIAEKEENGSDTAAFLGALSLVGAAPNGAVKSDRSCVFDRSLETTVHSQRAIVLQRSPHTAVVSDGPVVLDPTNQASLLAH